MFPSFGREIKIISSWNEMSCKVWEEMVLFCMVMTIVPPESEQRAKFWLDQKHGIEPRNSEYMTVEFTGK